MTSRTPTQVASHAQKYFIRQLSGGKDKRRASIHDITTVNLNEMRTSSPENQKPSSPEQSAALSQQPRSSHFQWNHHQQQHQQQQTNNGPAGAATAAMAFGPTTNGSMLMTSPYQMSSYGVKIQGQNLPRAAAVAAAHDSYFGLQNLAFQMQYPHG